MYTYERIQSRVCSLAISLLKSTFPSHSQQIRSPCISRVCKRCNLRPILKAERGNLAHVFVKSTVTRADLTLCLS